MKDTVRPEGSPKVTNLCGNFIFEKIEDHEV